MVGPFFYRFFLLCGLAVTAVLSLVQLRPGRGQDLPESAYVSGVVGHPQTYVLSCESRSAADWAAFWGVEVSELEFLDLLPRSDNPELGFVSDPSGYWGNIPPQSYGVHAEPVADLLRAYGLPAKARRGMLWDELRVSLATCSPPILP